MDKIKKSLKISFREGIFASVMLGLTEHYLAPLAIALRAPVQAIGALSAFSHLVAALFQLFSTSWAYRFKSRKLFIVLGALIQAILLLPIAFLPYLHWRHDVTLLILLATLFATSGTAIGPVWGSLMTDHVAPQERGRYFGWRNQRLGLVNVASHLAAGSILYLMAPHHPVVGFTLVFTIACLARLISVYLLTLMEDLPLHAPRESHFTFWMFIRRFRESNFVHFVLFVSCMTFSVNIAGPFFAVFMLRDLGFNYLLYTTISLSAVLTTLFSMKLWGEHADHVGNVRVLRLTSLFVPFIPIMWLFSSHPVYLIVIQVLSGFMWGGFNLAASNFIYDAVTPAKRIRCIAYFNVLNGTALSFGAILGGFLASRVPALWGYPIRMIFLISGMARILVLLFLRPTFQEVRKVRHVSSLDLFFSMMGIRPLIGVSQAGSDVSDQETTSP